MRFRPQRDLLCILYKKFFLHAVEQILHLGILEYCNYGVMDGWVCANRNGYLYLKDVA